MPSRLDTGAYIQEHRRKVRLHMSKSEQEHGHTSTSEDDLLKLLNLPERTQTWTRFDKRAKTYRTTSSSGPLWENVVARITIDDETGHIMRLEYTKHINEHALQRIASSLLTCDTESAIETVVSNVPCITC